MFTGIDRKRECEVNATKPTPGPWEVSARGEILGPRIGSSQEIVAYMPTWFEYAKAGLHATQDHTLANAGLIAAAPDLLEACKSALKVVSEIADIDAESRAGWAHKALDAAIAKAERGAQ